jgi:hypothetical protein
MDLQSSRYIKNSVTQEDSSEPKSLAIARIMDFPETDRGRAVIISGIVVLLVGLLLANFGAIQMLTAQGEEELAANKLVQWLPGAEHAVTRWVVFGITSALMAIGMTMVGSQTYHPSLLAMHVVVPVSALPMLFGYLYRVTINKYPMATQLWAGAGAFLAATAMVWMVSAVETRQSHLQIMIIAFQFQAALALMTGSLIAFWKQIRHEGCQEPIMEMDPTISAA